MDLSRHLGSGIENLIISWKQMGTLKQGMIIVCL